MLPAPPLRFVLATGVSEADITFGPVAFEGAKEIRPEAVVPSGSVATHFAIGGQGGR